MDIDKVANIIEKNSHIYQMLKNCPYQILKELSVHYYEREEYVIRQGEIFEYFNIIVQGEVNIFMMSENGKKYSQAIYRKGDFIGEIEIFDGSPSVCFVETLTKLKVLRLPVGDFLEWISIDSNMSYYFNRVLARYLFNLSKKAGLDSLYPINHRLALYLINNAELLQDNTYIVNMSSTKIADHLAVTPRSINRLLQEWRGLSVAGNESEYIVIFNMNYLIDLTK